MNDVCALLGVLLGCIGLVWQIYTGWHRRVEERTEHELKVRLLKGEYKRVTDEHKVDAHAYYTKD